MKGLIKSELKDGHVYRCLLSGNPVLHVNGDIIFYHNGSYIRNDAFDGTLIEIDSPVEPTTCSIKKTKTSWFQEPEEIERDGYIWKREIPKDNSSPNVVYNKTSRMAPVKETLKQEPPF